MMTLWWVWRLLAGQVPKARRQLAEPAVELGGGPARERAAPDVAGIGSGVLISSETNSQ
jgi:hypothetical protein